MSFTFKFWIIAIKLKIEFQFAVPPQDKGCLLILHLDKEGTYLKLCFCLTGNDSLL